MTHVMAVDPGYGGYVLPGRERYHGDGCIRILPITCHGSISRTTLARQALKTFRGLTARKD
jgi:hypothetical protein